MVEKCFQSGSVKFDSGDHVFWVVEKVSRAFFVQAKQNKVFVRNVNELYESYKIRRESLS